MEKIYDTIILGGGPSGLTAATYASRAHLDTLVLAGNPPGGQLTQTTDVENYPGFPDGIMGPDLIAAMRKQAEKFNADFQDKNVVKISGSFKDNFTLETTDGEKYVGRTVIVATGASARWLNQENEQRLRGKGVSACATCDGFFFKEKIVAVVGGGDSAMEESTFLTKFCSKVYVLVRGSQDQMKASKIMQKRALDNPKIEFLFNTEVKDVLGEQMVEGLKIFNNQTNEESELELQGLFLAIGHKPNTDFLQGVIELDKLGYAVPTDYTKSTVEGIFLGGDVADYRYRQAITAAGHGCMAALDAEKLLAEHGLAEVSSDW